MTFVTNESQNLAGGYRPHMLLNLMHERGTRAKREWPSRAWRENLTKESPGSRPIRKCRFQPIRIRRFRVSQRKRGFLKRPDNRVCACAKRLALPYRRKCHFQLLNMRRIGTMIAEKR